MTTSTVEQGRRCGHFPGTPFFYPDPGTPLPRIGKPLAARQEQSKSLDRSAIIGSRRPGRHIVHKRRQCQQNGSMM
jgi:hypothetical protein